MRNVSQHLQEALDRLIDIAGELGSGAAFAPADPGLLEQCRKEFDLPSDLTAWYAKAEPVDFEIPRPIEPVGFSTLRQLANSLEGYAYGIEGNARVMFDSWDDTWLVIGGEDEYPLIMRKARTNDPAVYYAQVDGQQWILTVLSEDLPGFLCGVAEYLRLYKGIYKNHIYQGDLWHPAYDLDPDFAAEFSTALEAEPGTAGRAEVWLKGWLGL